MHHLVTSIIKQLEQELDTAAKASKEAHSSATHSENVSTNRYDTLALEAAYLAHGQSLRIAELQEAIVLYKKLKLPNFTADSPIELGALVKLENDQEQRQTLFLGPCAGGLKIDDIEAQVVTTSSPLGQAMVGKFIDDEIAVNLNGKPQIYTVISIE